MLYRNRFHLQWLAGFSTVRFTSLFTSQVWFVYVFATWLNVSNTTHLSGPCHCNFASALPWFLLTFIYSILIVRNTRHNIRSPPDAPPLPPTNFKHFLTAFDPPSSFHFVHSSLFIASLRNSDEFSSKFAPSLTNIPPSPQHFPLPQLYSASNSLLHLQTSAPSKCLSVLS